MRNAILVTLLMTGCGSRIKGTIDGEKVDIQSAFFVQFEDLFSDTGDGVIAVYLASIEDGCDVFTDIYEDLDFIQQPEEAADAWADAFPEEWWSVQLVLQVSDPTDEEDVEAGEYEGVDWDEPLEDDEEVAGVISHYTDHLDAQYFSELSMRDLDQYFTDGGDLAVSRFTSEDTIRGRFETTVVDDQGDDEGEITIHFDAIWCDDLQDFLAVDNRDGNTDSSIGEVNVAACEDWLSAMECGDTDFSQLVSCDVYVNTSCDISDYFDCLAEETSCDEETGIVDTSEWLNCIDLAECS
jgi:hypothetical protein